MRGFKTTQEHEKGNMLRTLLQRINDGSKILIFVETKRGADTLTRELRHEGWPALSIHGDKKQEERAWVLQEFKSGKSPIMIATDVASRGLDVKDVRYVVNYDFPNQIEDYVHRIGRSGRAGNKGTAFTLFSASKFRMARDLCNVLKQSDQRVPDELARMSGGSGGGGGPDRRWSSRGGSGGSRGGAPRRFGTPYGRSDGRSDVNDIPLGRR